MKRNISALLLILTALACFQTSYAQTSPPNKVAGMLEESGYPYTKVADNVWTIPFEGKNLKKFDLIITTSPDILILLVVVAKKKDFTATPALMRTMLNLNDEFDRVKVGLDQDGNAFARIDVSIRVLDKQELKDNLDQASAAADGLFIAIKPFTKKTK